jgi:NAD(P)-dependent dehydrogenase (short-subunit alcohol dehydrogenase family)
LLDTQQKVVLVIGASAGIGRCCAEHLHRKGHRVYGASRTIAAKHPKPAYEVLTLDVNDEASIRSGIGSVIEREGRLDVLVNSAGFALAGPVEDTSSTEAREELATNFLGAALACREVLPFMRKQKKGLIVNIGSIGGIIPMPFQAYYSASKAGLSALSRALRLEVAAHGIHVTLIEPGDHKTEFTASRRQAKASSSGPYAEVFPRALSVMESDERKGSAPEGIGPLLERIVRARSPKAVYLAGPWFQRFAVFLRALLHRSLFDWGLMKYYGLK